MEEVYTAELQDQTFLRKITQSQGESQMEGSKTGSKKTIWDIFVHLFIRKIRKFENIQHQ